MNLGAKIHYGRYTRKERRKNEQGEKKSAYKAPDSQRRIISANEKINKMRTRNKRQNAKEKKRKHTKKRPAIHEESSDDDSDHHVCNQRRVIKENSTDDSSECSSPYSESEEEESRDIVPKRDDDETGNVPMHAAPVLLGWQRRCCFIDAVIQCFMSSSPIRRAILDSNGTWNMTEQSIFWQIATVMEKITDLWTKIDASDGTEDIDADTPLLNIPESGFTTCVVLPEIKIILSLFAEGVDCPVGQTSNPMELLAYMSHDVIEKQGMRHHPFLSVMSFGPHRKKHIRCNSCECHLHTGGSTAANDVGVSSRFVMLESPDGNKQTISALLGNFTSWKEESLIANNELHCTECNIKVTAVKTKQCFVSFATDENRVVIFSLCHDSDHTDANDERKDVSLSNIELSLDFTEFVDDPTGCRYTADLTGYIYEPPDKQNHYQCVVRGRDEATFFDIDDMLINDMICLGKVPDNLWPQPKYIFYTVSNKGCDPDEQPGEETKKQDIPASNKETEQPVGETNSPKRNNQWEYDNPIGKRGYRFFKKFDLGWYEGEVVRVEGGKLYF